MDIIILDPARGHHRRTTDFAVDERDLRLGDLLLFCPNAYINAVSGKFAGAIQGLQEQLSFRYDDARWHHAAIYIGGGSMVEAIWKKGVVASAIRDRFPGHLLRVRRLVLPEELQAATGEAVARTVHAAIGKPYDLRAAFQPDEGHEYYICSTLYVDALDVAFENLKRGRSVGEQELLESAKLISDTAVRPLPAFLSNTPKLEDVPVRWK